ncbi:ATP-binding cassette sub-family C member 5-like [Antedon mediterranea]|uniref:ATP-binding cassette sub-family C member 5-like n=1 Tax=Antedon mediterranea TaxID=105859 RepID=UPI003AF89192
MSISCLRDLKRLENVSRSPFLSQLTATIQGIQTMRAYSKETYFIERFERLVDTNSVALLLFELSNRWIAVRFDFLVMLMSMSVGVFTIMSHGHVSPAMVGLAITFSSYLLGTFQFSIRLGIESEARFTSVERLVNYIKNLQIEGKCITDCNPEQNWPSRGEIAFQNVEMQYRENLPLVLKGISFEIKTKEKIGIVGRTGSGKSSLATCLYRLVEVKSGCITIDNVDVSSLNLNLLRSKLSIIPQDPVLFVGSIRYNLDPFDQFTDDDIWKALEKTYMKKTISAFQSQLMTPVNEGGENFSLGERQLICMSRALLRKSKILILDEATAAIDTKTDHLIQSTIRQAFVDCTMLIIAHRLHTVQDCDRVMVLDSGKITEFDSPSVLLSNKDTVFSRMSAIE